MKCLNNGHKTELPLIFGTMMDPQNGKYRFVFKLQMVDDHSRTHDTFSEPSTIREKTHHVLYS